MKKTYVLYSIFVLLLFCSCRQQNRTTNLGPDSTYVDSVPAKYKFIYNGGTTKKEIKRIKDRLEIKSISMKRSACYGRCPVYSVKSNLNGSAQYTGKRFVDKKSKYMGKISIRVYGKLAYFIHNIDFKKLNKQYRVGATDQPGVTVIVTYKNGDQKKVNSYGSNVPIEFWALTSVIDGIKNEINWKKKG